jgi:hypothetical protein
MEEFKLVLDFETKRSGSRRAIRAVLRGNAKEYAFWKEFFLQANEPSITPLIIQDTHRHIREKLPRELKSELYEALSTELLNRPTTAIQAEERFPISAELAKEKREAISFAIKALDLRVKSISYGKFRVNLAGIRIYQACRGHWRRPRRFCQVS